MTLRFVEFNGVQVLEGWPEYIKKDQKRSYYLIDDKKYERVKYGDEKDDWGADKHPCGDCGVLKGQFHASLLCDMEECPCCGGQVISCDCEKERIEDECA